jgi:hypothetical protein
VRLKLCRAHFSGARQRGALPCVLPPAHGEKKTLGKKSLPCVSLPCVFPLAHDKHPPPPPPAVTPVYNRYHVRWLCRAQLENARQTYMFAVRFSKAHGKVFLKNLIFVLRFISPLQKHYFVLYISILYMS